MPKTTPLRHTPSQLEDLVELLSWVTDAQAPKKFGNRLRALIGLCEGRAPAEIARETELTRQGVSTIRKRVDTCGLDSEIEKVRGSLKGASVAMERDHQKPRRGRPAIPSLADWEDHQHPWREPVIELVQLVVTADVRWATFGMRPGRASDESTKGNRNTSVEKLFASALDADEGLAWTLDGLDFSAEFIFARMREDLAKLKHGDGQMILDASVRGRDLMANYSDGWRFVILHSGEKSPFDIKLGLSAKIAGSHSFSNDTFLEQIESLMYRLRVRENLLGIFPAFDEFRARVLDQTLRSPVRSIDWSITESAIDRAVRQKQVEFFVFGIAGVVFQLPAKVRKAIRQKARFPIGTISLRPGINAFEHSHTDETVTIQYQPIPEMGYSFRASKRGTIARTEEAIRKFIRRHHSHIALEYAVRMENDLSLTAYPHHVVDQDRLVSPTKRVAVVSLPRQWLMGSPPIPLARMQAIAVGMKKAAETSKGKRDDLLLFHAPMLMDAIRKAFRDNKYGDRLSGIYSFVRRIHRTQSERARPLSGFSVPSYYFSESELAGKEISIRTLRRLKDSPIAFKAAKEFGNPHGTEGILYPGYNVDRVFKDLFTNHDADFLLREIDDEDWSKLEKLAEDWRQLVQDTVAQRYWPQGRSAELLIKTTVRGSLLSEATNMWDLVQGWATDAQVGFRSGTARILRHTVENAQRLMLSGSEPVCMAARTTADLMRSWKSYLGKHLNGRILDELEVRGKTSRLDAEDVSDGEDDFDALFN